MSIQVLGVITARGGSKGIPKKNIKELHGKPLLAYTIEAAQKSAGLARTILSTDSEEIAGVGASLGCEVPFLRPASISGDTATSLMAIQHALSWIAEHEGRSYDYVMILQPTSPFRLAADIDATIALAEEKDADSVMSMVELVDFAPKKLKRISPDGRISPLLEEEGSFSSMRQEDGGIYKRNAAIYLTKVACIMNGNLFGDMSYAYIMPPERSLDINHVLDFEYAEFLMRTLSDSRII